MTEPQADSFVGPEGVYTQTEEHKPTLVSSTLTNTNGPAAAQIATKLGFVTVTFPALKVTSSQSFTSLLGGGNKGEKKEGKKAQSQQPVLPAVQDRDESVSSGEGGAADTGGVGETNAGQAGSDVPPATNPSSTDPPHTLLFSPSLPQNLPKRKSTRNKQNLKTTTSSFVTRYHAIEGLSKWFAAKVGQTTFVFYNAGKSVYFNEAETGAKHKEPLVRVTFSAWPTCHAINQNTASSAGVDIIIGFNTGDLMWFDPLTTRYVRLNKQGCISNSPCTAVHWVPGSRSLFLVSHANGTIVVYDKDREDDVNFQPSLPPIGVPATAPVPANPPSPVVSPRQINSSEDNAQAQETPPIAEAVATPASSSSTNPFSLTQIQRHLHINVSSNATPGPSASLTNNASPAQSQPLVWNSLEDIWVTRPGAGFDQDTGNMDKEKEKEAALVATKNPISHWRVARKGVIDFAFSPDVRYVAIISEDGNLRIIDALHETLVDTYASYFGQLTCVAWSPDGRFIATGGQDDLVTLLSPHEQRVIARCQGHSSFLSSVEFDHLRCDGRTYRFVSVGEDCKLILWDFSASALHRPRLQGPHPHRFSISSQYSLALRASSVAGHRTSLDASGPEVVPAFGFGFGGAPRTSASKYHPTPSRNEVSVVQPVLVKQIEGDILSCVTTQPNAIVTASRVGVIKLWTRPPPPVRGTRRTKGVGSKKGAVDGQTDASGNPTTPSGNVQVVG